MIHGSRASAGRCALLCLLAACRRAGDPVLVDATDITSDLYHRTKAGIFRPDREPLVLRDVNPERDPADPAYFRLRGSGGELWVKESRDGLVVVHMDALAFFAHWEIACETTSARIFAEWPVHPIQ